MQHEEWSSCMIDFLEVAIPGVPARKSKRLSPRDCLERIPANYM